MCVYYLSFSLCLFIPIGICSAPIFSLSFVTTMLLLALWPKPCCTDFVFLNQSDCLSVRLCLYISLSAFCLYVSFFLSVCVCVYFFSSVYQFVYVYVSFFLSICIILSFFLSVCSYVCSFLSFRRSICM